MTTNSTLAEVASRIDAGRRNGASRGFVGVRLPSSFDPLALLGSPAAGSVVASYERPALSLALVGIGVASRAEVRPGEGPEAARKPARRLLDVAAEVESKALRPRLLGGFRFNPAAPPREPWQSFGAGALTLPRMLFVRDGEVTGVVLAPGVEAGEAEAVIRAALEASSAPEVGGAPERDRVPPLRVARDVDRARWRASVATMAAEVRAGVYEKAVLAASMRLEGARPVSVAATLAQLRGGYRKCHLFSMRAGDSTFLGASPELLVSLDAGRVQTLALAGSIARGVDAEDDERLGRALLDNAKDRVEHETVVRAIRDGLDGATDELSAPTQPRLRRLHNIQHLATEITGHVHDGVDVLDLVARLHPTPAVCGWPRDVAREVIQAHEDFDRGWYAGPVGWMDAAGNGEFAVALRSAVVRGSSAWLFAGNGIMGDSDPEAELAEVQLKFRPLAEALGGLAQPPVASTRGRPSA